MTECDVKNIMTNRAFHEARTQDIFSHFKMAAYNESFILYTTSFVHCSTNHSEGRAIAQVVSCQPLTADTQVCDQVSPCGICGGQSGTGIDLPLSPSVFPFQYYSTATPYSLTYHLGDRK
jgi:hypothetical protein